MKTTNTAALEQVATELLNAYETKVPVVPPRTTVEGLDLADAYRIQQMQKQAFENNGRKVIGHKVGLTSLAMQRQLGVDNPDFGFFTEDQVFEEGAEIPLSRFIDPKIEPELAFVLSSDLPSDASYEDMTSAVASVHLAAEIIDSRIANWDITLVDTVADNASCGAVILDRSPIDITADDLADVRAKMFVAGREVGFGTGANVMGHPLVPLRWLAGTLREQGSQLKAGDIVLTGSFCGAAPVIAGQQAVMDYGPYGRLSVSFI